MSVVLLARNILEAGVVTVTSALAANPKERLFDRDRGAQCIATAAGAWFVDVNASASGNADKKASALGIINHNIGGDVAVFADNFTPATTLRATLSPAGIDPFYGTFTSPGNLDFWRVRVNAFASAPAIGEMMLGLPQTITLNPSLERAGVGVLGNVARDLSPAGHSWGVRLGVPRARLPYAWEMLSDADLVSLKAAFAEAHEGAKHLLVLDPNAVLRWMYWAATSIDPTPVGGVGGNNRVEAIFEEAL